MKRVAIYLLVMYSVVAFSTDILPKDFFKGIEGEYSVLMVNGKKADSAETSIILADNEEAILSMPYCSDGACNPGYIFINYTNTKIEKWDFGNSYTVYGIKKTDSESEQFYTWEENNGIIHFTNYQLILPNGKTSTMQHVIRKHVQSR